METSNRHCVLFTAPSGISAQTAADKLKQFAKEQRGHDIFVVKIEAGLAQQHVLYLQKIEHDPEYAERRGPRFENLLSAELESLDEQIYLHYLLNKPRDYLVGLWRQAAKAQLKNVPKDRDIIVILHGVYYHTESEDFVSCVDVGLLRDWAIAQNFTIKKVVTLIDDVDEAVERLTAPGALWDDPGEERPNSMTDEQWTKVQHKKTIRDMFDHLVVSLNWRRAEAFTAAELAHALSPAEHVLLATKHHSEVAYNILFPTTATIPVYISHPITQPRIMLRESEARGTADADLQRRKALALINQVQEVTGALIPLREFPAYAPTTIDEMRFVDFTALDRRWNFPPAKVLLYEPPRPGGINSCAVIASFGEDDWHEQRPMLESLSAQINAQIKSRDRRLVEQSRVLIVWRPYFDGVLARGVRDEIDHQNQLVRFGVRSAGQIRCLIMSPKVDLGEYRLKLLSRQLTKSLFLPATNLPPSSLKDLIQDPPTQMMEALQDGSVRGADIRNLIDPLEQCLFRGLELGLSPLTGVATIRKRREIRKEWDRQADFANRHNELAEYLSTEDLFYPYSDMDPEKFVQWVASVLVQTIG